MDAYEQRIQKLRRAYGGWEKLSRALYKKLSATGSLTPPTEIPKVFRPRPGPVSGKNTVYDEDWFAEMRKLVEAEKTKLSKRKFTRPASDAEAIRNILNKKPEINGKTFDRRNLNTCKRKYATLANKTRNLVKKIEAGVKALKIDPKDMELTESLAQPIDPR